MKFGPIPNTADSSGDVTVVRAGLRRALSCLDSRLITAQATVIS